MSKNKEYFIEKLWKQIITNKDYDKGGMDKYINSISINNEHMLMFIFNLVINKDKLDYKINSGFDYKALIKNFTKIEANSNKYIEPPILKGIKYFEKINDELNLDKEDWERIMVLDNLNVNQTEIKFKLQDKLHELNNLNQKNQQRFITEILEPILEKVGSQLDYYNSTELLYTIMHLMLKEKIPRVKDDVIKILIEKGGSSQPIENMLDHELKRDEKNKKTYLNYISKENAELIIEKADYKNIIISKLYISYGDEYEDNDYKIEKELRNKIYKKTLNRPENYLQVYLNVSDTGWSEEFINQKIEEINANDKSEKILEYWIDKNLEKTIINPNLKNRFNNEQIKLLINGLNDDNSTLEERNVRSILKDGYYHDNITEQIGYKLLKKIKDKELYKYNIEIPYLKDLLEQSKSKNNNQYLLEFYLDKSFNKINPIREDELINYVNNGRDNEYKNNFFKECFNLDEINPKKTGKLLSFAINSIKLEYSEDAQNIIQEWFFKIKDIKENNSLLTNWLKTLDIESIIFNKKLLVVMGNTVLSSIGKIEEIWNINIDKERLINEINFNTIKFIYKDIKEIKYERKENADKSATKYEVELTHGNKTETNLVFIKEDCNIWNELVKQQDKNGNKVFSNEIIEKILNSLKIESKNVRSNVITSLFEDEKENNKFIKKLIKENEKIFENLIKKIIDSIKDKDSSKNYQMINNERSFEIALSKSRDNWIKEGLKREITEFTKKLLILKSEIEFDEELIMKAYNQSNKEEIEPKLIKKAQIISLMEEKELNNIDIAYSLIDKNKNNFYKLGKQLIEFLQLDKDNSEAILIKYNNENLEGLFKYFKRKEKVELQQKINEAIIYAEQQQINTIEIKEIVSQINLKKLTKEEKEKVELVLSSLDKLTKDILKNLMLSENSELKNCIEKTFIGTINTYSRINESDKKISPELKNNFNEIMNYCLEQINKAINKNNTVKPKI